jgi:hypothetical protein
MTRGRGDFGLKPIEIGDNRGHSFGRRQVHHLHADTFAEIDDPVAHYQAGGIVIKQRQFHLSLLYVEHDGRLSHNAPWQDEAASHPSACVETISADRAALDR